MNLQKRTLSLAIIILSVLTTISTGCNANAVKLSQNTIAGIAVSPPVIENDPEVPITETVVSIPINGKKNEINDIWGTSHTSVAISDDCILSLTTLSGDLEICWFLEDDYPNCAYRRNSGEWIRFLAEETGYRDGFGAALYGDLFGHSGFFIMAPRGTAYFARDYYYFDEDGELQLLFQGTYLDAISDFNDDGETELLWFYHAGRDAAYNYTDGADIFRFDIVSALSEHFSEWEYIWADPLSVRDDTWTDPPTIPENVSSVVLRVYYQQNGVDYCALVSFIRDEMIVSTGHDRYEAASQELQNENLPPDFVQLPDFNPEKLQGIYHGDFDEKEYGDIIHKAILFQYGNSGNKSAYSRAAYEPNFMVYAPTIHGIYEESGCLSVFVTVYFEYYLLNGNTVSEIGGAIIPGVIMFKKDIGDGWELDNYIELGSHDYPDGELFYDSLCKLCVMPVSGEEIIGLAININDDYSSNRITRQNLLLQNLKEHLLQYNQTSLSLQMPDGSLVELT